MVLDEDRMKIGKTNDVNDNTRPAQRRRDKHGGDQAGRCLTADCTDAASIPDNHGIQKPAAQHPLSPHGRLDNCRDVRNAVGRHVRVAPPVFRWSPSGNGNVVGLDNRTMIE